MHMRPKHFNLISKAVRDGLDDYEVELAKLSQAEYIAFKLADALAETNPRFDRERFLSDCGTLRY